VKIETVDFMAIPTRDIERSVRWYTEVLGLFEDPDGNTIILHRRCKPRA
jgi:extradiol dioxygenase family protein